SLTGGPSKPVSPPRLLCFSFTAPSASANRRAGGVGITKSECGICLTSFCAAPPNARFQARRTAGARDERTLFAVACKPLFGQALRTARRGLPPRMPHGYHGPHC